MRYTRSAITQLTRWYRQVLVKCAILNSYVLIGGLSIASEAVAEVPDALTPTRGENAAYTWSENNNGQISVEIPVIIEDEVAQKTYYITITPDAPEGKDYTWNSSTRKFTNLSSAINGTGYYIGNTASGPVVTAQYTTLEADFIGNSASGYAGAFQHDTSGHTMTSLIGDFIGNTTANGSYGGGAIFNWGDKGASNISLIKGNFIDNRATNGYGGAIYNGYNRSGASISIVDSSFIGNYAGRNGGAIYNSNGVVNITAENKDVLFLNNSAGSDDTGIYNGGGTINFNTNNDHKIEINDKMYLGGTSNVNLNTGTLKLGQKAANNTTFTSLTVSDDSTLDLQNDNATDVVTFSTLAGSGELKLNVDYDATANTMDKINVNAGSGNVKLDAVNITDADESFENETETTYLDGNAKANITVSSDKTSTVYDGYVYEFTPDTTNHGLVSVSRALEYTGDLINAVADDVTEMHPNAYSMRADFEADRALGTLNNENRPDGFTIFGNNHKILGENNTGIKVASGDTLNINKVAEFSGASDYAVNNAGELNISDAIFKNNATADINNSGTVNFTGTNSLDKITGEGAFYVDGGVTTVEFVDQDEANVVSGELALTGTNNISTVNLSSDATLTVDKDAVSSLGTNSALVANGGTLNLANNHIDTLTFSHNINNTGGLKLALDVDLSTTSVISDIITASLSNTTSPIYLSSLSFINDDAENGEFQIADGSLKDAIQLATDFDSGIYATANYNNTTGVLSLSDRVIWFRPTLGSESGYKFTKENTGIIPVTYGDKTFYTDIKKTTYGTDDKAIVYSWANNRLTAKNSDDTALTATTIEGIEYVNRGTITNPTGNIAGDFIGNSGSYGGAINNNGNSNKIDSIKGNFIANYASGYAGVLRHDSSSGEIGEIIGDFIGNYGAGASYGGGAILTYNAGKIGSIKGDFIGNYQNAQGGAIYNYGTTIENIESNFIANKANTQGGAIYNYGTIGNLKGNFIDNISVTGGGAIYNHTSGQITSITGDFINNKVTGNYNAGAIMNYSNGTITVKGDFIGNEAYNAGAIMNGSGSTTSLVDSSFKNNIARNGAGAAIYNNGGTVNITAQNKDIEFTNNNNNGTSTGTGTGIYLNSGTLNLEAQNDHKIQINDTVYLNGGTTNLQGGTVILGQNAATTTAKALNITGDSTLDLQNNNAGDVLTVTTLGGSEELKLNVDYDATSGSMDKMTINGGSGTITLNAVNVMNDNKNFVDGTEATYLDGTKRADVTVRDTALNSATDTGYLYTFTPDENTHGLLTVARRLNYDGDFINAINDDFGEITPNSFSLSQDYTATRDMGTLNNENRTDFTIFGNGNNILRGSNSGIEIENGDILNIDNTRFSGTSDYALKNGGTLNFTGVNTVDKITGAGTTNINGNTTVANLTQGTVNIASGELKLTGTNNITNANINGGILNVGSGAVESFSANTTVKGNGGTLSFANENIDTINLSKTIDNTNSFNLVLDVDMNNTASISDTINASVSGNSPIYLTALSFINDSAESGEFQIADGGLKGFINLADNFDSGIYATANYNNTTGVLSLSDRVIWFRPTLGNDSGYKFTKTNTGLIPVTYGENTYYTEIKKTSYVNGDIAYTWDNTTKKLTATPSGAKSVAVLDGTTYAGDTVGNAISTANTGAITVTSEIDDINGDFISNAYSGSYNGSALRINAAGTVKEINSNFIGNSSAVTYQYAHAASAIDNLGTITTLNGDFIGNTTAKQGVIYNGGTITEINGDFIGNNDDNGAIYNAGTMKDINGNFIANNSSSTGGGIYNNGTITGKIKGIFTKNSATQGPAIYNYNGHSINEIEGTFTENTADSTGGALFIAGNVNKIEGTFENNTATTGEGGAIYVSDYTPGATGSALINVGSIEGTFKNNTAGNNGGAIYSRNKLDSLQGTFESNTAGASGGAIYSSQHNSSDILNISNSTFKGNIANGTGDYVGGGAIWNGYKLNVDNSTFENNSAIRGGAIYNSTGYNRLASLNITDSSFIGNIATSGEGGAIYQVRESGAGKYINVETTIYAKDTDVEFTNNNSTGTVQGTGTGIYVDYGIFNLNADEGRKIVVNDDIYSTATNTINVTEEELTHTGTVELNGAITNAVAMTVNNGTLKLGQKAVTGTATTALGNMTFTSANNPTLDLQNESYGTLKLSKITGSANLNLDLDLSDETAVIDNFNVTGTGSSGTLTIDDLAINGDLRSFDAVSVITGTTGALTLAISDALQTKYSTDWEQKGAVGELHQNSTWDDTYVTGTWKEKTGMSFAVVDNTKIKGTYGVTKTDIVDETRDVLALLNQSDDFGAEERTFKTTDATTTREIFEDLGTTASGTLTVEGAIDGEDVSTLNFTSDETAHSGFEVTQADTTLNIKNVNVTGLKDTADGQFITLTGDDSTANLENVTLADTTYSAISNDQELNLSGNNDLGTGIVGTGTTNITGGKTVVDEITQGSVNITAGELEVADITATNGITNAGTLTLTGTANANTITGTGGKTVIKNTLTNTGAINQAVEVAENAALTSTAANLSGTITNAGTLNLSGSLAKAVAGTGTTKVATSLALASGASVAGKLDMNSGLLNLNDNAVNNYAIGTLKGTGNLSLDIDLTQGKADTLTAGASETGALTITGLNISGTMADFTVDVLKGSTSALTLALSNALQAQYNATSDWADRASSTDLTQNAVWGDEFGSRTWQERNISTMDIVDNAKIAYTQTTETQNEQETIGDTIALLNQADQFGAVERKYTTDDATKVHTATADFGTTAAGQLTVVGATDSTNTSTINMNNKNGFVVTYGATVALDTVNITGAKAQDGSLISNTSGTVRMNNVTVANNANNIIANDATMTLTGTNNINAGISGDGTTNITKGSTTLSTTTQEQINIASGATLNADATKVTATLVNSGTMNLSGATNANTITGSGITTFSESISNSGNITQSTINVAEGKTLTNTGTITVSDNIISGNAINNVGTMNLNGQNMSLSNNVSGNGTTNVNGKVTLSDDVAWSGTTHVADAGSLDIGTHNVTLGDTTINGILKMEITDMAKDSDTYTGGHLTADSLDLGEGSKLSLTVAQGLITEKNAKTGGLALITVNDDNIEAFTELLSNNRYSVEALKDEQGNYTGKYAIAYNSSASDVIDEVGGNGNNKAAGEAWDSTTPMSGVAAEVQQKLNELSQHDAKAYTEALTNLAPTDTMVHVSVTQDFNNLVDNQVADRLSAQGMNSGDVFERKGAWVKTLYNHSKQDATSSNQGFRGDTAGVAFGLDGKVNEDVTVGVGYAYAESDIDSLGRKTDVESHSIYGYGKYQPDLWYLRGLLSLGTAKYEEKANVGGIVNHSDYHVRNLGAAAYVGYDLPNGITPEAGMRANYISRDSYNDSLGQHVKTDDIGVITGVLGAKYATTIRAEHGSLTPLAHFALTYDILSDDANAVVNVGNNAYNIQGKRLKRLGAEAGVGIEYNIDNWDLSAGYDLGVRQGYSSHTGSLKAKYNF